MTDKELRKLNRMELLEILLEQSREIDRLQDQLQQTEEKLTKRQLLMDEAGSIADAALRLNDVFEAAQNAADQYLDSIRMLKQRQEAVCAETEAQCRALLLQARQENGSQWVKPPED